MNNALYDVETVTALTGVAEYLTECVDVERFLGYCRECGNFDSRWACPSFDFDPMSVWEKYEQVWFAGRILRPREGCELPRLLEGLKAEKELLFEGLLQMEKRLPGSFALSAGSCYLCPEGCSRPLGEPCRQPERMRYSIEALGGDVAKTGEHYLKTPLVWIKQGQLPAYLTLVGGLLLKDGNTASKEELDRLFNEQIRG